MPVADPNTPQILSRDEAVSLLVEARYAINAFRDGQRWILVGNGGDFTNATFAFSLFASLLLVLAIVAQVDRMSVIAGGAYFIVGALAGLLARLNAELQSTSSVEEDYNTRNARLWRTPLLSGAAGLFGVVLIAMVPATAPIIQTSAPAATAGSAVAPTNQGNVQSVQPAEGTPAAITSTVTPMPTATAPPAPSTSTIAPPRLLDVFSLSTNPQFLLIAAIFGVTPSALIGRLQQLGDDAKNKLASTRPT